MILNLLYNIAFFSISIWFLSRDIETEEPIRSIIIILVAVSLRGIDYSVAAWLKQK